MPNPKDINPFHNEDFRRDPFPFFHEALANQPVVRHDQWLAKAVSLFRYDDVKACLKDWSTYSSFMARPEEHKDITPSKVEENFITMDPPRHTAMRRIAQQGFLPTVLAQFKPVAEQLAKERVDYALSQDSIDLINDFAVPITIGVITKVLGLPIEDLPIIRRWALDFSDSYMAPSFLDTVGQERIEVVKRTTQEMVDYFHDYIAERRKKPKEGDIVSAMMTAKIDGVGFTPEEVESTAMLLLLAGNDSTTNLIANYIRNMARFPEQADLIRDDLSLIPKSIEESVRLTPSFLALERRATKDVSLHGVDIKEGDMVNVWIAAANRDPSAFENPDVFDVHRRPNAHLGFGHGIHMCIGAPLARIEATAVFTEAMSRTKGFEILEEAKLGGTNLMFGGISQKVRFIGK